MQSQHREEFSWLAMELLILFSSSVFMNNRKMTILQIRKDGCTLIYWYGHVSPLNLNMKVLTVVKIFVFYNNTSIIIIPCF